MTVIVAKDRYAMESLKITKFIWLKCFGLVISSKVDNVTYAQVGSMKLPSIFGVYGKLWKISPVLFSVPKFEGKGIYLFDWGFMCTSDRGIRSICPKRSGSFFFIFTAHFFCFLVLWQILWSFHIHSMCGRVVYKQCLSEPYDYNLEHPIDFHFFLNNRVSAQQNQEIAWEWKTAVPHWHINRSTKFARLLWNDRAWNAAIWEGEFAFFPCLHWSG